MPMTAAAQMPSSRTRGPAGLSVRIQLNDARRSLVACGAAVSYAQHMGKREQQEDALLVMERHGRIVAAVADGMGGHESGEVASSTALATLAESFSEIGEHPLQQLVEAVATANAAVYALGGSKRRGAPGTTLVAAILDGSTLHWACVGDSELALLQGGSARLLAKRQQLFNGMLYACLGVELELPLALIQHGSVVIPEGATVALWSDGVRGIGTKDFEQRVAQQGGASELIDAVLAADHPRQDNATVILVTPPAASKADGPARARTPLPLSDKSGDLDGL